MPEGTYLTGLCASSKAEVQHSLKRWGSLTGAGFRLEFKPLHTDDPDRIAYIRETPPRLAPDPLLAEIKRFNDYNAVHPEVVVGVEKADDPQYNGIWNVKMGMLASIEALSKTLHREKEVEPLMELKSVIRDGKDSLFLSWW